MFGNEDHFTEHIASASEACAEYVSNCGADHPEREWILSPYDTWHRNPHFVGVRTEGTPYDEPQA